LNILVKMEIWNSLDKINEERPISSSTKTSMKGFKITSKEIG